MFFNDRWLGFLSLLSLITCPAITSAADILRTQGFSTCLDSKDIVVEKVDIEYNKDTNQLVFDVAGSSAKTQNVTAALTVTAYGNEVYKSEFNPCESNTFVTQLCPVPVGRFAATGSQEIPERYVAMIPAIAFAIPDLDGTAKLELIALDGGGQLACIESAVNNGKTTAVPAVSYISAGVASVALVLSGVSAGFAAVSGVGAVAPSPTFGEVLGWFQSMAMNGMLSVSYPPVYRSFTRNFAFSGGLFYWESMQVSIDDFRNRTGGNLTEASVEFLKNARLIYSEPSNTITKRSLNMASLFARDLVTSVNGTTEDSGEEDDEVNHIVKGIQGYVEQLTIPESNTFMTVLMVLAVVIAAITVGVLLFKVILETWALWGTLPRSLASFRKRYWLTLAKTITNLILVVYGIWTLYCVYQFTNGDSWAAKLLAGVTLALFTAVLGWFTFRIWQIARRYRKAQGDVSALYEDKETWRKYSIFYENYKRGYWWLFVPTIVYMFAKGCFIAGADGHGMIQAGGQLLIEALLLGLLLWARPYELKSSNWINIVIQVVRVLSVACILLFVEELGVPKTTQTITGVALMIVQSVLTGLLAILIAVNAIIICCKENPHRRKRKEAEKLNRDGDDLTPLDAHNSLLLPLKNYGDKPNIDESTRPLVSRSLSEKSYISHSDRDQTPPPPRSKRRLSSRTALLDSMDSTSRISRQSSYITPIPEPMHHAVGMPDGRSDGNFPFKSDHRSDGNFPFNNRF